MIAILRDAKRVFDLLRDLTFLYHPISLDIRWRFTSLLSYIYFRDDRRRTREQWEKSIRSGAGDDGLNKFVFAFLHNGEFRRHLIEVLSYEKDYFVKHNEAIKVE